MLNYLIERLNERSTVMGLLTSLSALGWFTFSDTQAEAIFTILTFILGGLTASIRDGAIKKK